MERGGQITVGDDCEIRHHAVLEVSGRYNGSIVIGNHCVIGIGNWLQGSGRIQIGNDVIIGPYVAIVSTNHCFEDVDIPLANNLCRQGRWSLRRMSGSEHTLPSLKTFGSEHTQLLGANSFVNKDVPPYSIVVGTPAKVIRSRK